MKKRLACFIFTAAMVLSMPAAAFAADTPTFPIDPIESEATVGGDVSVMSVSNSTIGATRNSNVSGTVTAYAMFTNTASKSVCCIYLQEKYNGSWRTATGLGTTSYVKTAYNTNSISAAKTFTLIKGKVYRAKIVFNDTINGSTYTKTRYTGSF
ncbi:MAG: hypothetical protein IKM63_04920 [Firmicutes bacterium]|nr:hypothetical protein [Bacillota bacterium]